MFRVTSVLTFALARGLASEVRAQGPTAQLSSIGGGVLGARQEPADIHVRPGESVDVYIFIFDETGALIPHLSVGLGGNASSPSDGGHTHAGSGCCGSFSPTTGNTGVSGDRFRTTFTASPAGATLWPQIDFEWDGYYYSMQPLNGIRISQEPDDYPWLGDDSSFVLVGSTTYHPSNHYGTPEMNDLLVQLACMYNERW